MLNLTDILTKEFSKGLDFLVKKDRERLKLQGHYATGRLDKSIRFEIKFNGAKLMGQFYMERYGLDLDRGLKPHEVRYSFEELKRWARVVKPSLSENEINRFVANTWRKHKREGVPTKASLRWSKTGERTNWIKRGTQLADDRFSELFNFTNWIVALLNESVSVAA